MFNQPRNSLKSILSHPSFPNRFIASGSSRSEYLLLLLFLASITAGGVLSLALVTSHVDFRILLWWDFDGEFDISETSALSTVDISL